MRTICQVDKCDSTASTRGWCRKHYTRWLRHGSPTATIYRMDLTHTERIDAQIDRDGPGGCWLWLGRTDRNGYARSHDESRREGLVHRWMWQRRHGPVPDGLELDHLCRVRRCVNPDHLEPVTHAENVRRGNSPGAIAARTDECMRGHDLTKDSYVLPDGGRMCRECARQRARRRYAEKEKAS